MERPNSNFFLTNFLLLFYQFPLDFSYSSGYILSDGLPIRSGNNTAHQSNFTTTQLCKKHAK